MPVTIDKLLGKPLLHKHRVADINATGSPGSTTVLYGDGRWDTPPSGGAVAWGDITGTLSDQTDLNSALSGKQDALGFTPENVANKVAAFQLTPDDTHYPTEKLVKDNIDLLSDDSFYASTMTVNTGTLDTGTVSDLAAIGGTDVNISESNGADPLRITFDFTGVTKLSAFVFYGYYAGGSGHQIQVEIYNQLTTNWDFIGMLGSGTEKAWYSFPIYNTNAYLSLGNVSVRLRHIQTGNTSHDLILDYLEINYGGAGGSANIGAASVTFVPTGNISSTNVASALSELDSEKVIANAAITGATKTKITYDAKGLVTSGADATTADIADSLNKRYVTDAQLTVIGNTSGTNTGDETQSTIKTKLGAATASVDGYATSTQITKLDGIAAGAEVNVNADWNSSSGDSQILNKPTLGTAAAKNIPAAGDASVTEVVYGTDTRLTNSRTPTSHNNTAHSETYITASSAVAPNAPITGATKTKITYDSKGLVTAGADATTADIAASTNKNYVTDAQLTVINNTSGTNTGDQTLPTDATIVTTDVTTNNVSTTKHGWFPKLPTPTGLFLKDDLTWAAAGGSVADGDKGDITVSGSGATWTIDNSVVTEAKLSISDNTTGNVSTSAHGFVPKAPNSTTQFLRGDGTWAIPCASIVKLSSDLASTTSTTLADTTGISYSITAGTFYRFSFQVLYQAAATTTGIRLTLTTPSVTTISAVVKTPVSTAGGGTASEFGDWITSSGDAVVGTGTPLSPSTTFIATIDGVVLPSANGTLQLRHASEVASSGVTVKAGTNGLLWTL